MLSFDIRQKTNKQMLKQVLLFYIVLSGPFIAHYAVWALLIVEGRTVTYSC